MIKPPSLLLLLHPLLCLVTHAQMPPISTPVSFHQQPFDVLHYEVLISLPEPPKRTINGSCSITAVWTEDIVQPSFPFHLRDLTVDSVHLNGTLLSGAPQGFVESDTFHYRYAIGQPIHVGDTTTFVVWYSGTMSNEGGALPWGGVHYEDSVLYALGVGFNANYVSTTAHWMPCYDHPSDKATLRATFTVPHSGTKQIWEGAMSVASVGRLASASSLPNNTNSFTWEETTPTATYLYTFAAGPFVRLLLDTTGEIPFEVYTLARDVAASQTSYSLLPQMENHFSSLFGDYPFAKVGYVNTVKGAMEHQTLVSFPVILVQRRDTVNTTAAHELAHQWFGDLVSPQDFSHVWLTEAFATYCEGVWLEHLLGWDVHLNSLASGARTYIQRVAPAEGVLPLYNFSRNSPSSNYPETIYRKGALVVAMMRALAGDSAFYTSLRSYLQENHASTATTATMKQFMKPALGSRTDAFFDQWVYGVGWPILKATLLRKADSWVVHIEQVQSTERPGWPLFTTLPLNITYTEPLTGRKVDTILVMEQRVLEVAIAAPQGFAINSGSKCRSLIELQSVISIDEQSESTYSMRVFPQPTTDVIDIEWQPTNAVAVHIYTLHGILVENHIIPDANAKLCLDVSHLPSGSYSVVLERSDGSYTTVPLCIVR